MGDGYLAKTWEHLAASTVEVRFNETKGKPYTPQLVINPKWKLGK